MNCLCGKKVEWDWSELCIECTDEAMHMAEWMENNAGVERGIEDGF